MSYKKIIPCLDVYNGRVVKGVNFVDFKDAGDPAEIAEFYCAAGADELVFLDITATSDDRDIIADVVKKTAEKVTVPLTVGGGIRTIEDFRKIINAGANKVSVNSAAVRRPELINEAAKEFGSSRVVIAIDVKKRDDGGHDVYLNGGRENTGIDAVAWAKEAEERGAGEILLTSMDGDGTKEGYDLDITRKIAEAVNIPVTASGGAGKLEDFYDAFATGKAAAALAASLFHFRELEIRQVKQYLADKGIAVKL
jgi:cyclase